MDLKDGTIVRIGDELYLLRRYMPPRLKFEGVTEEGLDRIRNTFPFPDAQKGGAEVPCKSERAFVEIKTEQEGVEIKPASEPIPAVKAPPPKKLNGKGRGKGKGIVVNHGAHPIAERIQAYLNLKGVGASALDWPVSEATVYNVLKGRKVSDETITKLARHLDAIERQNGPAHEPIDESKVEVLPNKYDDLNTGNPLPKHEAPPRCAETP